MSVSGEKTARRSYMKKDFDKEKMYRKIMPTSMLERLEPTIPPLHNYMEDILRDKLPGALEVLHACGCARCERDIIALALNSLPTLYLVMDEEEQDKKLVSLRGKYDAQATAALIQAIRIVRARPRHKTPGPEGGR